ncbi:MAG: hypothetical protein DRO39_03855 [Thermoprotei archaeon]|nr:MAG: hypothetical protein DRO39_03855 [Thermoprotei archaeon]
MKTPTLFMLLLLSLSLFLGIATAEAESAEPVDESQAEVVVIISADNMTTHIIGRPDIDTLIVDGYDLSEFKSALIKRVNRYHRSLLCLIMNAYEDIYTLAEALNMTLAKVTNNTYLILSNRRDIVLVAVALNKTMHRIDELNSTLSSAIDRLTEENAYQWKAISIIRSQSESDKAELASRIAELERELELAKEEYERKLSEQEQKHRTMMAQLGMATLCAMALMAVLIPKISK